MIIAIASVKNEADIITKTVTHLLAVGADRVVVSDGHSTDGTQDVLASLERVTLLDQDGPFDQPSETMRLAHVAWEMGAAWVVPFDADEFWTDLTPLRDLDAVKAYATVYGHRDWSQRHLDARRWPKVCFRDACAVAWGNHEAETGPGHVMQGLQIRELQYQSFPHFLAKIDKSAELFAASEFSTVYGSHMRTLVAMSDEQRRVEWARLRSIPCVYDPIPYRGAR